MMKQIKVRDNREIFERMSVPKALMTLAVPTIIGQLIVLIYSLADTFFIGRSGNGRGRVADPACV